MRIVNTFYGMTVDISDELVKGYSKDLEGFRSLGQKLEKFAELDSQFLRYFLGVNKRNGFSSIRMLESHGNSGTSKGFLYSDLIKDELVWYPVNDWLNEHDGKYDVLYVSCCNEGRIELEPRKSIIIYPMGQFRGKDLGEFAIGARKTLNLKILDSKLT